MDNKTTFPTHLLPPDYLNYFRLDEYKFRWHEASGLDPELHFRANHLASRLTSLWIVDAHTFTSKQQITRITNTSIKTTGRALAELEDRGWVHVSRAGDRLSVFLTIPQSGFDRLIAEHQSAEAQRITRLSRELAAQDTLGALALSFGVDVREVQSGADWKVIRSRVRSITNRMSSVETETRKLIEAVRESVPPNIRCPQAFISSRLDEHLRNYPHLSHRPTKASRRQTTTGATFDIQSVIDGLTTRMSRDGLLSEHPAQLGDRQRLGRIGMDEQVTIPTENGEL
jgi:hypothetical protein